MRAKQKPVHPGEILQHEFLIPLKLSQYRLAKDLGVPARRINEIIHGTRSVSADTALRLSRYFGTTPKLWLNLQMDYELDCLEDAIGKKIHREVKVYA